MLKVTLSRIHAIEVARLDPKPLDLRETDPNRVEINTLHLSVHSFWLSKRNSTAPIRIAAQGWAERRMAVQKYKPASPLPEIHDAGPPRRPGPFGPWAEHGFPFRMGTQFHA